MKRYGILFFCWFPYILFAQAGMEVDTMGKELVTPLPPQHLHLSHIEIQEQFIDFRQLKDANYRQSFPYGSDLYTAFDSIVPYYNYPASLDLPYHLNTLTFHYTAIDWKAPHKIKYSYQLEGFDSDWSEPTSQANVLYRNLPFGQYTFKVKATDETLYWSPVLKYPFVIQRPWWHSGWAYLGYLFFATLSTYSLYLYWKTRKQEMLHYKQLLKENQLLVFASRGLEKTSNKENTFLQLVNQTLETHLSDENFGIAELCKILPISRAQLHRRLKKLTGKSTSHYIRTLRLDIARGLLEKTDLNVSEVAFTVGFSSANYFSKVFKEEFGMTPSEIRSNR